METYEKIRVIRELNQWSQEEMAEKLNMSATGYAKIERGQSRINLEKLQQIANIFNVNISELVDNDKPYICLIGDHSNYNLSQFYGSEQILAENEKLKLILKHKEELLEQKEEEILILRKMVGFLEAKQ